MALLKGICHSILLCGNLNSTNHITLKLPFEDIYSNLWQISLNQLSVRYKKTSNVICGISCNFVTDIKYNDTKQITNYFPILWQSVLKGKNGDNEVKQFDKTWFYITSVKDELVLSFHLLSNCQISDEPLNLDCDLYITLLIQRVQ